MPAGKGLLGGAEHEPAVHGDLTRSKAQAVQLGGGLVQQAVLARVAGRAGRGQDIPAGAASNVGGDLGDLGDVAELAWLAKLALTDRARVGIAQRHQPVADLLLPQPLLDLGADPLAALSERLQPPGGAQLGLGAAAGRCAWPASWRSPAPACRSVGSGRPPARAGRAADRPACGPPVPAPARPARPAPHRTGSGCRPPPRPGSIRTARAANRASRHALPITT